MKSFIFIGCDWSFYKKKPSAVVIFLRKKCFHCFVLIYFFDLKKKTSVGKKRIEETRGESKKRQVKKVKKEKRIEKWEK